MAGNAVWSTRGLLSDPNPSCLTAMDPQVKLVFRETNPLLLYCTWPQSIEGWCGLLEHHDGDYLQQPPRAISLEHLLWDFRGHQAFPSDRGHCGRSQDVSEVVVLCVWGIHLLPGHPETQCVSWGWQHSAQPYGAFMCWFFSAWGSSLFHRWLLCSPRIGGCPWSRCAAAEPSILLSYPIAMAGKAGFVPSCLCWYCLLLAICVVSLLAFFLSENDMSCP